MEYLFILGRNIELSKAEIISYFNRIGNPVLEHSINGNGMLIDVKETLLEGAIDNLGGVIAIGEVLDFRRSFYDGDKNKVNYVLWDFSSSTEEISEKLKKWFKEQKIKATRKTFGRGMKIQSEEFREIGLPSSKLIDEEYFVFDESFGRIIQKTDSKSLEKRDMGKPVRRERLSISPRLAKIMINLSEVKPNGKIVDPFCGIGVVLFESLLQGLKVTGIDSDGKAVDGALKNLIWGKFNRQNYQLINNDSRKVRIQEVDSLVSEPDLGETFRKMPTKDKANKSLRDYENLMEDVINNLKGKVKGRIVFTAPFIRTNHGRKSCNIEALSLKVGRKVLHRFEEFRGNQIVGREIFVLGED